MYKFTYLLTYLPADDRHNMRSPQHYQNKMSFRSSGLTRQRFPHRNAQSRYQRLAQC